MIVRASRAQNPPSAPGARPPIRRPSSESSTGCRVSAAAIDDERDQQPTDTHRAKERNRQEEQDGQARTPRRGRRRRRRVPPSPSCARTASATGESAGELLAEAVDDQERVVDRECEPDQLDEVRHVRDHRERVRERLDDQERARDRAGGEDERDRDREREAEDGDQHQERDRERDRLPAPEVAREDAVEVALDRRLPGHVRRRAGR